VSERFMSALSGIAESRPLIIAAVAICFFVAAVLVLLIFRLAFGRRLRMSGGRGRQLRLGIVDAFDLDRQRQLVIVRRDNVEHLVMIGGPNDVLLESQIVRAEARDSRETRSREKEFKEPPQMPPLSPALAEPKLPLPPIAPVAPEPLQPAAQEVAPLVRLQPANRGPMPPSAVPPRRTSPRPDIKPEPLPKVEPESAPVAAVPIPPPSRPAAAPAMAPSAPNFLRWAAARNATAASPAPMQPAPAPAVPASEETREADPMESLEEEMAKLLGRGPGKP
jgi:flagellar protein FliO/FliZ